MGGPTRCAVGPSRLVTRRVRLRPGKATRASGVPGTRAQPPVLAHTLAHVSSEIFLHRRPQLTTRVIVFGGPRPSGFAPSVNLRTQPQPSLSTSGRDGEPSSPPHPPSATRGTRRYLSRVEVVQGDQQSENVDDTTRHRGETRTTK